ncbi:MAG: DUF559 domain-containing protein [Candidatus Pacearchaeota archaeon]|jgi:very-short-patch-repair endonuclease
MIDTKFKKGERSSSKTEFKKGSIPWNKGLKGEEYKKYFPSGFKGIFKKGSVPSNKGKKTGKPSWMTGKHPSKETIEKQKISLMKTLLSSEVRKKMSISQKKRFEGENVWNKGKKIPEISGEKHPMFGKHHSKETILKIKNQRIKQIFPLKDSKPEIKIQNFLKQLNIEFITHKYIKEIEHGYQCDILISNLNLIIEVDGNYWHKYPLGREIDNVRTNELQEKGFKVIRLWESDIKKMNIEDFKNKIQEILKNK